MTASFSSLPIRMKSLSFGFLRLLILQWWLSSLQQKDVFFVKGDANLVPRCPAGDAILDSHGPFVNKTGSLAEGGIRVLLGGSQLLSSEFTDTVSATLQGGVRYTVVVDRPNSSFRGILCRLGTGLLGSDTTSVFSVPSSQRGFGIAPICPFAFNVSVAFERLCCSHNKHERKKQD